jgi:hypothetical protein
MQTLNQLNRSNTQYCTQVIFFFCHTAITCGKMSLIKFMQYNMSMTFPDFMVSTIFQLYPCSQFH